MKSYYQHWFKYSPLKPYNILYTSLSLQIITVHRKPVSKPSRVHLLLSAFECRADSSQHIGGDLLVLHECLKLHVFVLQSCLGSTGAFPGRVCSVSSSFCASGNPMTDSILMWLSQFNSTDSREFERRLEINTAHCTFAWNCTSNRKKGEERNFIQRFC